MAWAVVPAAAVLAGEADDEDTRERGVPPVSVCLLHSAGVGGGDDDGGLVGRGVNGEKRKNGQRNGCLSYLLLHTVLDLVAWRVGTNGSWPRWCGISSHYE